MNNPILALDAVTAKWEVPSYSVEWTHSGGLRGRHSSQLNAPLRSIHGRR